MYTTHLIIIFLKLYVNFISFSSRLRSPICFSVRLNKFTRRTSNFLQTKICTMIISSSRCYPNSLFRCYRYSWHSCAQDWFMETLVLKISWPSNGAARNLPKVTDRKWVAAWALDLRGFDFLSSFIVKSDSTVTDSDTMRQMHSHNRVQVLICTGLMHAWWYNTQICCLYFAQQRLRF